MKCGDGSRSARGVRADDAVEFAALVAAELVAGRSTLTGEQFAAYVGP